jgi:DNA-binding NarL/FixJ family response regulator
VIDPELVASLVARGRETAPGVPEQLRAGRLSLMAQGMSNAALADELHPSPTTIESYVTNIFTKLDLAPDNREHRRVLTFLWA